MEWNIPAPSKIIPTTLSKLIATIYLTVIIIYLIMVQTPITLMEWTFPEVTYIPKRLRRKSRWKTAVRVMIFLSMMVYMPITAAMSRRASIPRATVRMKPHTQKWFKAKPIPKKEKVIPLDKHRSKVSKPVKGPSKGRTEVFQHMCFPSVTMRHPVQNQSRFDDESFTMAIDNACSYCVTNDLRHYVGTPEEVNIPVKGIGGVQVQATKVGTVKWSFSNDQGQVHEEFIPNTYYHERSPYCLYSPQHVAQVANDNYPAPKGTLCISYDYELELIWDQRSQKRTIKLDPQTNIFLMQSAPTYQRFHAFSSVIEGALSGRYEMTSTPRTESNHPVVSDDEASDDDNDSVTSFIQENEKRESMDEMVTSRQEEHDTADRHPDLPLQFDIPEPTFDGNQRMLPMEDREIQANTDQAQLLAWHYRLGHLPFKRIQRLAEQGDLPSRLATCATPKCASCMYGKGTRRAWRTRAPLNAMTIPPATAPGSVVSIDQMESSVPGLIAQMKGFLTRKRYNVATIYVDHYSGLSYVYIQKGSTVDETVEGKRAFERYAKNHGVRIHHYHSDNGIFEAKGFQDALAMDGQTISYCGVNAHHQNGRAEKKIRDLQELARTMMLHAKHRWPDAITTNLWPHAIKEANDIGNRAPSISDGVSPIEKFSQVDVAPKIRHSHTFGSPVYVLESALQVSGKGIPKWDQRANIGIYLGTSPRHSRKVALVLNLKTGHVSPQFHVVFDDFFETLRPSAGNVIPRSDWQKVTGFKKTRALKGVKGGRVYDPTIPLSETMRWTEDDSDFPFEPSPRTEIIGTQSEGQQADIASTESQDTGNSEVLPQTVETNQRVDSTSNQTITRSGRVSTQTARMKESVVQQTQGIVSLLVEWEVFHDETYDIQDRAENPIAFLASSNPDVMYLDQAMKEPDRPQFEEAMVKEVKTHTDNGNWIIVDKAEVPDGIKILPAVWAMRRKRRITTGEVYKWKARLNVHGGKQEYGVNYWETYAPVISWTTIRLYLVLAVLNKRSTRQIDFVLAYPQAEIECDLYMEIPKGFVFAQGNRSTHCLLLKRNLYGQKQAGRVWNEYLHEGLLARGFRQSQVDMCLYHHDKHQVDLMIYTDDGILTGRCDKDIDAVIELMRQPAGVDKSLRPFDMTDEGEITDYLGVKVERMPDGTVKLSQPHLIQQVIDDLGFNERTKVKQTPAKSKERLHRDMHGEPMSEAWHYRSVIGKLNFIEKSTRPDIAYAVHQCARFSNDPKASHASAVKRIVKYLMATKHEGIYLRPDEHSFDCWVDADFVGNWNKVYAHVDPSTAKSRTGYIINYAGCPITWGSKLQTEVALSTTEAEYNALSTSLREVIHLMQLINEAKELGWQVYSGAPNVHCKVFEDNVGALEMARLPKMRPRTKHLCVRLHHFREHVRKKLISIHHIATELQIADLLTKPQPLELFMSQRSKLMKWPSREPDNVIPVDLGRQVKITENDNPHHLRACGILSMDESVGAYASDDAKDIHQDIHQGCTLEQDTESRVKTLSTDEGHSESSIRLRVPITDSQEAKCDVSKITDYQGSTKENKEPSSLREEEVQQTYDLLAPEIQTYHSIETYGDESVQIYMDESLKSPRDEKEANNVEGPYIMVRNRGRKKRNKNN